MPKLAVTQTVEVAQTVTLSTKQQLELRKQLQLIEKNRKKIKALESEVKTAVGSVEDVLADLGVEELEFEGFKSKIVAGERAVFDKELFVRNGGSLDVYNRSMVKKPVSAYVKVSSPTDKGDE